MTLEDANYYNDSRVMAAAEREDRPKFDEKKMMLNFCLENEDGVEVEFSLPAVLVVCQTCEGKGKHVNPSIDAHGITSDEWDQWSHEEQQEYRDGTYDVSCYGCGGLRVVPIIREDGLSAEQQEHLKMVRKSERDEAEYRAICRAERAMGC